MSDLLRFVTCGSVDDGKSTLIGRLLQESRLVHEHHADALAHDTQRHVLQCDAPDFALPDGLAAEPEQGMPIDVAYRYFATPRRRFIVADAPGHERYTRAMATGASAAQAAVIVIDARKGVTTESRRHSRIVRLFGVDRVIVAVNKMDLVGWDEAAYEAIRAEYEAFARTLAFRQIDLVPVSALRGDNVVAQSARMPWYAGPTLLERLEALEVPEPAAAFRMPVQCVDRAGQSVSILPADAVDVGRGGVLACAADAPEVADQFEADLLWMSDHALVAGRQYDAKIHSGAVGASVTRIKYRVDIDSGEHLAARTLALNDIGLVNLSLDRPVAFEPYAKNRTLGSFILIDRLTKHTVGAGMLHFALRRAANLHRQALTVNAAARAAMKQQTPRCLWLTGLPASGKSTIADLLDRRLHAAGYHTFVLDGDNVRHGLSRDLGFTEADRVENNRRVAEVARLMVDAGLIVIVSFISPFSAERAFARSLFAESQFIEVFVDAPAALCEERDPKGLYAKARAGQLKNFTGFDSPYEAPAHPEAWIRTAEQAPEEAAELLFDLALHGPGRV